MGLGKTPTVLAHVLATAAEGPTLVIAPPAVVGNWRSEASVFTPDLHVQVHHGATRATPDEIADEVSGSDLIVTTYGTALRDLDALADVKWHRVVLDEAQAIKNPAADVTRGLHRLPSRHRLAMTGTPVENGLGDLWSILDFVNPGLLGDRADFVANLSRAGSGEAALRALNGILVFRRTKDEPEISNELPERIDETDHCTMTAEQIGLYQAVIDKIVLEADSSAAGEKGRVLAAITKLKQICNHPAAFTGDTEPLGGRSGKLARLEDIIEAVFAVGERIVVFTQYATWAKRLAEHLTECTGTPVAAYHGGLNRTTRDRIIDEFQSSDGAAALVLSLKAGGAGLNLTAANHVVLYDRWWNPAVEDQARDRAWRIGQDRRVIFHRLECPGTIDERVEEIVAGKRHVADLVLPKSSSLDDLDAEQLRKALGLREDEVLAADDLLAADVESVEVTA
jgi:SNF2 family DNA or RNA helicase